MYSVILVFHIIFCIALVAVVLLQVGRGRGMLGFMGGGTAESLFGSRTGDVLTKSTTFVAVLFMVTSLSLAYLSVKKGKSVMKGTGKITESVETGTASNAQSDFIQKSAGTIERLKQKIVNKIPNLTKEAAKEEVVPTETTKSKIDYDGKGNKIVDETKYNVDGSPKSHTLIKYDKTGNELGREELPLENNKEALNDLKNEKSKDELVVK